MVSLFNDNWQFAEIALNCDDMYKNGERVCFSPDDFFEVAQKQFYAPVSIPHDWQIWHVQDLYKNSVGCYKKSFVVKENQIALGHSSIRFEGVYMNCAVWVNGKKAGEWKYGYSAFEFDISDFLVAGENVIFVIAVYQNCNSRWYSGAGIFRDVWLKFSEKSFLTCDGGYFRAKPCENEEDGLWECKFSQEVCQEVCQDFCGESDDISVQFSLIEADNRVFWKSEMIVPEVLSSIEEKNLRTNVPSVKNYKLSKAECAVVVEKPRIWDIDSPYFYFLKTDLFRNGKIIDSYSEHFGFKSVFFDKDRGLFLNGRHIKIQGACQHHDLGCLGSAFDKNALRRQFLRLKEMGVNAIRCSHNPPPKDWLDLCDEMGFLADNEVFDMWKNSKTPFDYSIFFDEWYERDATNWVRRDRNHPCLLIWSIGNEISDTQNDSGLEITKALYNIVRKNDSDCVAQISSASNYMMTEGAQKCADELDLVGYNYLEYLYDVQHKKNPEWKIYGSETSSTVQSRGVYHFPESLNLVTFSDGQCSSLGNCSTSWGAKNTQTVITNERDCSFSAGQFIWTGWDYIGEPTPFHSKNSFFGQIDTAGFPKDSFYLFKSEWNKNAEPFVHLLPYWDWNEGQIIDVKAYSNCVAVELFVNGKSFGVQKIDHSHGMRPFGQWQVEYHKGEIKAIAYNEDGKIIAEDVKRSFGDPEKILIKPESFMEKGKEVFHLGNLFFIDLMVCDKDGNLVENARNYITFNVAGKAELVGMDNGDSTDYDEYKSDNGNSHSRRLFGNRVVAVIRTKVPHSSFVITAASEGMDNVSMKFDGEKWVDAAPYWSIHPFYDYIPARKIELSADGSTNLNAKNNQIIVSAKVLPENASDKKINWNPVLKECVPCDFIEVLDKSGEGTGFESVKIKASSNGTCILRCTAKNESNLDEVISDLNFSVSDIKTPLLNPYKLIEGCRFDNWDKSRAMPEIGLESGITNRKCGPTWISFSNIDFGKKGSETIHIPIFSFETEVPIEVWEGTPADADNACCLGHFTYRHESVYNTFNENVFKLNKKLRGIKTISIIMLHEFELKGIYFDEI